MNRVVLFDMDGTLTEPRQQFERSLLGNSLLELSQYSTIGIVTGSDEDYLFEQMGDFLSKSSCRYNIHLLPCNGTKLLTPPESSRENHNLVHEVSMEEHLGVDNYHKIIKEIISEQSEISENIPLTGHFVNCRGSMINWCPIGRNATTAQRDKFIQIDKKSGIRKEILLTLREELSWLGMEELVTVKLGGDTSFDIYPKGWDKTYALKHFKGWDVWFVGDRCSENGNDYEIYKKCQPQSFITDGPPKTKDIVNNIINKLEQKNEQ